MKPFAFVMCAAALSGAVVLGAAGAEAQTPAPQAAPQADRDLPARLEAAKELSTLISKDTVAQMVTQMGDQVWPAIEKELRAKNPTIDAASLAGLRKELERIQLESMSDMLKDAPAIYARYFTEQELRELIAFYRTPVGAKILQTMPQISGEIGRLVVSRLPDLISRSNDAFAKILSQRGYKH